MRRFVAFSTLLLSLSLANSASAQFWRFRIPTPPPRIPVVAPRVPTPMPHYVPVTGGPHSGTPQSASNAEDAEDGDDTAALLVGGIALLVIAGVICYRLTRRQTEPTPANVFVAEPSIRVRIHSTPPGNAPESIRRAWIGLTLPLRRGEAAFSPHEAREVISNREVGMVEGYSVPGSMAMSYLLAHAPDAHRWWIENVPEVMLVGYELVFPTEVCELESAE